MLETLDDARRAGRRTFSPRCSTSIPKKGLAGLQKVLQADESAADDRRGRYRPPSAAAKRWPAWCNSSTACRSSRITGGTRSGPCAGSTTSPAFARWSPRRFQRLADESEIVPRHLADRRRQGSASARLSRLSTPSASRRRLVHLAGQAGGRDLFPARRIRIAAKLSAFVCTAAAAIRPR